MFVHDVLAWAHLNELVSGSQLPPWRSRRRQEKWGKLTDDDLTAINGKRDQLVGKIQQRYGIAKEAEKQVDEFTRSYDSGDSPRAKAKSS